MGVSTLVPRHRTIPDVEPGLTMDEYLRAFLERWEVARAALVKKHQDRAEHYKHRPGMALVHESEMRALRHYEHEAAMLAELRRRSVDP